MRLSSRSLLRTAAVTACAAGAASTPAVVQGQQPLPAVTVSARTTQADQLDARAAAIEEAGNVRRFGRAARLRERAAELRAPEDSAAYASLRGAANIRYGLGQAGRASALMERAADQAMARGDVYRSADAYLDAAYAAVATRDGARARTLFGRGALLLHSPLLAPTQRELLRVRVAGAPAGAGVVAALGTP